MSALVGFVVDEASTSIQAVVVGAELGLEAVLGPWWGSNGGGRDDVSGGSGGGLEDSLEGSPEPVFRRFSYSFMAVFGTVLFLYHDFT